MRRRVGQTSKWPGKHLPSTLDSDSQYIHRSFFDAARRSPFNLIRPDGVAENHQWGLNYFVRAALSCAIVREMLSTSTGTFKFKTGRGDIYDCLT